MSEQAPYRGIVSSGALLAQFCHYANTFRILAEFLTRQPELIATIADKVQENYHLYLPTKFPRSHLWYSA